MIQLNIPYLSQINGIGADGFRNDCGPTCCWMLLKGYDLLKPEETVDKLYQSVVKNGDRYTSWQENKELLQKHGIYSLYDWDLRISDLEKSLLNGHAIMVLVHYGLLRNGIKTYSAFSGNHFMLVVGMDEENFYVHDPLWLNEDGKFIKVKKDILEDAWLGADGAKGSALFMTKKIGETEVVNFSGKVLSSIGLNLRSGPSVGFEILGRLAFGEIIELASIKDLENGDAWGKIAGCEVWCAIEYQGNKLMEVEKITNCEESGNHIENNNIIILKKNIITAINILNETLAILE